VAHGLKPNVLRKQLVILFHNVAFKSLSAYGQTVNESIQFIK